jgi:HD-like signal output (HDOD) protein
MLDLDGVMAAAADLAPLPASVTRLAALTARDDAPLAEIVDVVRLDQALTVALLRLVNSAAFAGTRHVTHVRDAVLALGSGTVLELAVGREVRASMKRPLPAFGLAEGELWRHSVASALAAQTASRFVAVPVPPEAFTVALLHDVGKLVLARFLDGELLQLLRRAADEGGLMDLEAEAEVLGVHHGELGQLIAQNWGLPDAISAPLAAHHRPTESDGTTADVAHLADVVAKIIGAGRNGAGAPRVRADAAARLGIDEDGLERLARVVRDRFVEVLARYEG